MTEAPSDIDEKQLTELGLMKIKNRGGKNA